MKNNNKLHLSKIWISTILLFFTLACEDFVETDLPPHLLIGEEVFNDPATVEAAFADIYVKLRDQTLLTGTTTGLSNLMGHYADEMEYYSSSPLPDEFFFQNNLLPTNPVVEQFWDQAYNLIYASNAILEGLENSSELSTEIKNRYKGEALFLRALIHHYLTSLFGDIPYISTTNYEVNTNVFRMPINEVSQMIQNDLYLAKELLPAEDLYGEKIRPNKWAATALLARVHLYNQNWQQAADEATTLIDNFNWEINPENVFKKSSTSTIWQFYPPNPGLNTHEAQTFIFFSGPPPARALSENLFESFEENDLRKSLWVGQVNEGASTWYYSHKYKELPGSGTSNEYSKVFRLAEQYLIRAEALIHLDNLPAATNDINRIRNRAGLPNTTALSAEDVMQAIIQERRFELFTEHGHRWFDLKRTNSASTVLSPIKPGWNDTDVLLPIPEKEILINPNLLPQNQGY